MPTAGISGRWTARSCTLNVQRRTDALELLELGNVEMAKARLRSAQQMCEEIYMQAEDDPL